jgi:diguanylate cyclase (GGDEF)-like protein/PAS domain S-box-containing protein
MSELSWNIVFGVWLRTLSSGRLRAPAPLGVGRDRALWKARGLTSVLAACGVWRARLATCVPVLDLLPPDHAVFGLGLEPLVDAAVARHEVVVSPGYFLTRGHVLDLAGPLSIGVASEAREPVNVFDSEGSRAARFSRLFAAPKRAAIVLLLATTTATVDEMSTQLGRAQSSIRRHLRQLRLSGIVERVGSAPPARYRTVPSAVDGVLNEVSALLQRGHGRSTRLNADRVSGEASFRAIFDRAPFAMLQLDLDGRCISCNDAGQRLFGYSAADLSQLRGVHLLADDADRSALEVSADGAMADGYRDVRLRRKNGSTFWSALTLSVVHDNDGRPRFGYAMIEDISERRGAEDLVTGLPNRALFTTRLERILTFRGRGGDEVTLLMIDLDGFKLVNDALGHEAGDEVLRQVGARLAATLRASDMVARLGGDEFAVIPTGSATEAKALLAANKIRAAIRQPFVLSDGRSAIVDASVGIAISPRDGGTVEELLRSADRAMYVAKRSRRVAASRQASAPCVQLRDGSMVNSHRAGLTSPRHEAARADEPLLALVAFGDRQLRLEKSVHAGGVGTRRSTAVSGRASLRRMSR